MPAVYARIDTAFGENGAHIAKQNPELWGKTLDEVSGEPAGTDFTQTSDRRGATIVDRNPEEITYGAPDRPQQEGDEEGRVGEGYGDEVVAGAMVEHPLEPPQVDEMEPGTMIGDTAVIGDATMGDAPNANEFDKAAAAKADEVHGEEAKAKVGPKPSYSMSMTKDELLDVAKKAKVRDEDGNRPDETWTKPQIIAELDKKYGTD